MPTYFVLATKRVELRGHVKAKSRQAALEKVREEWYIYDHETVDNAVCAGIASETDPPPEIAEYESPLFILYLEDIAKICTHCGQPFTEHNDDGSCKFGPMELEDKKVGKIKKGVYGKTTGVRSRQRR